MERPESTDLGLAGFFLRGLTGNPEGIALEVGDEKISYRALGGRAACVAKAVAQHKNSDSERRVGIVASHTVDCFAGVLGILLSGNAYVPLNPSFPAERLGYMIATAGLSAIVAHESVFESLRGIDTDTLNSVILLVTGGSETPTKFENGARVMPIHLTEEYINPVHLARPVEAREGAYTMFTSGSTGRPKGVEISHANITAFLDYVLDRYDLTTRDRFSQMFELTFDLSLFDLFVCWAVGGTLCAVPPRSRLAPAKFIREKELTVWFSVPSVGSAFAKLRVLRPNIFPSLRLSLFCGEALTQTVAELWAQAAPNSTLENLYGPTEATVACAFYRWDQGLSPMECEHGVVPLGEIFPRHDAKLIDEHGEEVTAGDAGELCVAGPQVCPGYLLNEALTAERFSKLPCGTGEDRYYHTGDLVRKNENGQMLFLGRTDFQIKLHGYRIEMGEIEHCLRKASDCELVAVVCETDQDNRVSGLIGFIGRKDVDISSITENCRERLPAYMVPGRIVLLEKMPLNANGKIDRNQLLSHLRP